MDKKNNYEEWIHVSSELCKFLNETMTTEEKINTKAKMDSFIAKLEEKYQT